MRAEHEELPLNCMLCRDGGILGGADTAYFWCQCERGKRRQIEEPELVNEANKTRDMLEKRYSKGSK